METFLVQHGGTIGVLAVVVMLLVKELVSRNKKCDAIGTIKNKMMTKELCLERHKHLETITSTRYENLEKQINQLHETSEDNKKLIDRNLETVMRELRDLPRKINGGQ